MMVGGAAPAGLIDDVNRMSGTEEIVTPTRPSVSSPRPIRACSKEAVDQHDGQTRCGIGHLLLDIHLAVHDGLPVELHRLSADVEPTLARNAYRELH